MTDVDMEFAVCPVCGESVVMRLRDDWADGRDGPFGDFADPPAIPIVGCGNPWHYATASLGDAPRIALNDMPEPEPLR